MAYANILDRPSRRRKMDRLRPIEVLLAEDNIGDVRLTQEAIKESKLKINLNTVVDGVEAWEYLTKQGRYKGVNTPDLLLLDLNMPRMDGREVLKLIKEDASLRTIPVAVLTISKADEDILQSYQLHVNCYISKPLDLNRFIEVVQSIENFWFTIVTLPPRRN